MYLDLGISYNSNIESLLSYNPGDGKTMSDYEPNSNDIIDKGVALQILVSTSISTTNQLNNIVPLHSSWKWNRYWRYRW